jgi:hypothetical protein
LLSELERRHEKLLPLSRFLIRLLRYALATGVLVVGSLLVGMWGYHHFENLSWLDSFLNASMILGGMGPVNLVHTNNGKLFAGFYALYSGLVILAAAGLLLTPLVHRILHRFHIEE